MLSDFDRRQNRDGLWEIYDTVSGEVVVVDGMPLSGLGDREAREAVDHLHTGRMEPDNIHDTQSATKAD
ncbi:hypothetical protein [Chelativorans salis]|uniref:Uncharacterized protein n=1 Tax=Chelativorans salis TaxID=2978478 RepID=A0ABT2LR86_9HYPH|nr:hypothetical protein [Chelativorans sp. EGI FJ00035]MCT7377061.1 hypothetical protein [Chelativorans sp. EGI FJ00035]